MTGTAITTPALAGARASAADLVAAADVRPGAVVTVDLSASESLAQGYCDELVKQLCEVREADVTFTSASARAADHIDRAARLRGVTDRVVVLRMGEV